MARMGSRHVVDTSWRTKCGRRLVIFANGTLSLARTSAGHNEAAEHWIKHPKRRLSRQAMRLRKSRKAWSRNANRAKSRLRIERAKASIGRLEKELSEK